MREAQLNNQIKPKVVQSRTIEKLPTAITVEEAGWLTTREAWELYGKSISQNTFRKLTPENLRERFRLESDLSRRIRGKTDSRWLKRIDG